ncbi:4-nitrophenyl phosphatase [Thermosporothrix hazakensis]|jgi:HAD superfamily hydrolase (TIGR01457 family)|uniref:4-nitrophenyl phosphatase n=1 Tax=Thermosporothrix hazakensis TaxID=644383 RepID=A0A326U472_THEHA|nr:HAD-IIA family hydrolase [Thermosporothrix hazakensis]PZW26621.1 4-nitrophenyl phosphatase [Thermosporothrix hazakensis]GCE47679.1 haloacid dehalogenase [Thermosporothrix hazakensis]
MLPPYTTYLIDLDGVVYRGETLVPGAKDFISWLERTGKKYLFPTNNSFASEAQVVEKLNRLGIPAGKEHVLGAGQASVRNIARRFPGAHVFVIGEQPLIDMVIAYNLPLAREDASDADVVLVGLDRTITYQKLTAAVLAVRRGAHFIAINRDPLLPVAGGFTAGTGTMVAAIEAGSGVTPQVIGKPQPALLQEALNLLGSTPEETVMIGDGLEIDIKAGKAAGTHTMLVLSGKESRESLARSPIKPDLVYENLGAALADVLE